MSFCKWQKGTLVVRLLREKNTFGILPKCKWQSEHNWNGTKCIWHDISLSYGDSVYARAPDITVLKKVAQRGEHFKDARLSYYS